MQIHYFPFAMELLPEKFLMSSLRQLFETILNRKLDRRNFQRKALSTGVIDKLKEKCVDGAFKPADLYSFNKAKYNIAISQGFNMQEF